MRARSCAASPAAAAPVIFEEVLPAAISRLKILPQGTMDYERMRAGAAGIPAFFTATGAGTKLAAGKEARTFDGREYILEHWIRGDVALVEGAWRADRWKATSSIGDAGHATSRAGHGGGEAGLTVVQTQHVR